MIFVKCSIPGRDQTREAEPEDHALGRSRGGFSTKVHWLREKKGLPLSAILSAGAAGDAPHFLPLLEGVKIPQAKGRPRTRPQEVVADQGCDSAQLRRRLRQSGIKAMIPERRLPQGKKRRRKGPHYRFDKDTYKKRVAVEQSIGPTKSAGGLPLGMRNRPLVSWLSSSITSNIIHWTPPSTLVKQIGCYFALAPPRVSS